MWRKLSAVVLVLGLVSSTMAGTCGWERLLIHYTMDAADSVDGYQLNSAWGSIRSDGDGNECFYSSDGIDYGPGLIGDALYISNDGTGLDPNDPNSWMIAAPEMGDYIDIEPTAESLLFDTAADGIAVSMWFKQTKPLDINNHVSQWQSKTHAMCMPFGTHWKYYAMIKVTQDSDKPGVEADYLSFKIGGKSGTSGNAYFDTGSWTEGVTIGNEEDYRDKQVALELNAWYHVAFSLGAMDPVTGLAQADVYVNGVLLHSEEVVALPDARGGLGTWPGLQVGAYHEISKPDYFIQIPDGMLIDDFAILCGGLSYSEVNFIYRIGLCGWSIGHPVGWLVPGDFVYPCGVNMADFSFFAARWMRNNCEAANNYCEATDLDRDGDVDFNDLKELADYWLVTECWGCW